MYRCLTEITITQDALGRNKTYKLNFCTNIEIESEWSTLTNTAKVVLPKNLYIKSEDKNITWFNKALVNSDNPILVRGDKINIKLGYLWRDSLGVEQKQLNEVFDGYITKINNRIPIELECQDNMYKLKQIQLPSKSWKGYTLGEMLKEVIGDSYDVSTTEGLDISTYVSSNVTVAQAIAELKKIYGIEVYFKGNKLISNGLPYQVEGRKEVVFDFQQNVISDDLNYKRKDDQNIVVRAISMYSDGTKKKKLSLYIPKEDASAEVKTFHFLNVNNLEDLRKLANDRIKKYWHEGWQGNFETFGLPFCDHGDVAILRDKVIPERNGAYLIKKVTYEMGMNGYRQRIELDIKLSDLDG